MSDAFDADLDELTQMENRLTQSVQRIDQECHRLLRYSAIFETLNDQAPRYPESRAAHGYNWIVRSSLEAVTLTLTRLWDNSGDALSIPAVVRIIETEFGRRRMVDDVTYWHQRLFEELERNHDQSSEPEHSEVWRNPSLEDRIEEQIRLRDQILGSTAELAVSEALVHIREFRHTQLAHPLDISITGRRRRGLGQEVRGPYIDELRDFSSETLELVEKIRLGVLGANVTYSQYFDTYKGHIDDLLEMGLLAPEIAVQGGASIEGDTDET